MPTVKIVIGPRGVFVDAPVSRSEHLAFDPLSPDVVDKTPQLPYIIVSWFNRLVFATELGITIYFLTFWATNRMQQQYLFKTVRLTVNTFLRTQTYQKYFHLRIVPSRSLPKSLIREGLQTSKR